MFPKNTWYVACTPNEIDEKPLGRTICGERIVFYRGAEGKVAARGGLLPAPRRAAVAGLRVRRQAGLRLPRPGDGLRRQDGLHAGPARARLPGHPQLSRWSSATASSGSGPATRRRPTPAKIPHLEWHDNPEWAYGGGLYHIALRLPADDRQPDGPDARDLCAHHQHRPEGNRRNAVQDHGRGRHGGHQPLHERHHAAAVLEGRAARQRPGRRRAGGPLADLPLHAAQPRDDRGGRGACRARAATTRRATRRSTAWWWTSSRPRPRPRSSTSGAWRASSTRRTRR